MARKLQEILDGVKLTGADSDQLAKTLTTQAATPRTDDELRAEAERAMGTLYSEKQMAAQQRYDREQTALRSQLDALGTSYQRQAEQAEKNTRLALSGADQRALSRGMGRSSYNLATLGNIQSEGNRTLDYIQQNRTNQEGAINTQMTQQSQQLADILASYQVNRETDIMARIDELRSVDKKDTRAATEYNNNLIMALADRLSQERERERLAGLQEREMGLKESSTAFSQEMTQKQFDWTMGIQDRELTMKEKANAFDEAMRTQQFDWTKGIQEREMTLKEKAEAYDQMAAEREYERLYGRVNAYPGGYTPGNNGGGTRPPPKDEPPPKDVPLNSEPVRYIPSQSDLEVMKKNANMALINSVFGNASTPAGKTLKPPVVTNAYKPLTPNPILYTDGYQTSGSKVPTLLQRFGQLE